MKFEQHRGIYGRTRFKMLRVLEALPDQWVSSRNLILNTGAPFLSTQSSLMRWSRWGYVERRPCRLSFGYGDYEYRLTNEGRRFLDLARAKLRNAGIFERELEAWWLMLAPEIDRLIQGTYKEAQKYLNENYQRVLLTEQYPAK